MVACDVVILINNYCDVVACDVVILINNYCDVVACDVVILIYITLVMWLVACDLVILIYNYCVVDCNHLPTLPRESTDSYILSMV